MCTNNTVASENRHPANQRAEQAKSEIYADIVARILNGDLLPGQKLVETALAEQYGVSRTRVREVLFTLLSDGLVKRTHNRGTRVVSFSPEDIEDIYEIRKALECLAIRTSTHNAPLDALIEIERRLRALEDTDGADCANRHAELDIALHKMILSYGRNQRLGRYLDNISLLIHSLRLIGYKNADFVRHTAEEHLAIVQAMMRRDPVRAERLLAQHIDHSKRHALDMLLFQSDKEAGPVGLVLLGPEG